MRRTSVGWAVITGDTSSSPQLGGDRVGRDAVGEQVVEAWPRGCRPATRCRRRGGSDGGARGAGPRRCWPAATATRRPGSDGASISRSAPSSSAVRASIGALPSRRSATASLANPLDELERRSRPPAREARRRSAAQQADVVAGSGSVARIAPTSPVCCLARRSGRVSHGVHPPPCSEFVDAPRSVTTLRTMAEPKVLVMVLAGGEGKRLLPLTNDRAKPAVPFGGTYRIIDFALSNFANATFLKIVVLTQYKSHSLDRHISQTWRFSTLLDNYVTPVPAQMRRGPQWFQGSADAIYQNLNLIHDERPDIVCVFGADHIYRMDHAARWSTITSPDGRRRHRGGDPGARSSEAIAVRRDRVRRRRRDPGVPREVGRPADDAGRRHALPREHGQLRVRDADVDRHRHARPDTTADRHGRRRDPGPHPPGRRPRLRLLHQHRARAGRARARLLARRRDARRLLRRQHGPDRAGAGVQPLQRPVAGLHAAPQGAPAGEGVARRRAASRRSSTGRCCVRARSCRARTSSARSSAPSVFIDHDAHVTDSIIMEGVHIGAGARLKRCIIDKNVVVPDW